MDAPKNVVAQSMYDKWKPVSVAQLGKEITPLYLRQSNQKRLKTYGRRMRLFTAVAQWVMYAAVIVSVLSLLYTWFN